jgi:hypothetical protein
MQESMRFEVCILPPPAFAGGVGGWNQRGNERRREPFYSASLASVVACWLPVAEDFALAGLGFDWQEVSLPRGHILAPSYAYF